MKSRNIPVDGVGLQMHINIDNYPPFADVEANIVRLGALGLEVHVTEMDVVCINCTADRQQTQANVYAGILSACLKHVDVCKSFETWGFTDKYSWLNGQYHDPVPLPFTVDYQRKSSFYAMLAVLQQ